MLVCMSVFQKKYWNNAHNLQNTRTDNSTLVPEKYYVHRMICEVHKVRTYSLLFHTRIHIIFTFLPTAYTSPLTTTYIDIYRSIAALAVTETAGKS